MTSGAIQKGVPTNVFLLICVSVSCPATPKSASFTSPCSESSTLAAARHRTAGRHPPRHEGSRPHAAARGSASLPASARRPDQGPRALPAGEGHSHVLPPGQAPGPSWWSPLTKNPTERRPFLPSHTTGGGDPDRPLTLPVTSRQPLSQVPPWWPGHSCTPARSP